MSASLISPLQRTLKEKRSKNTANNTPIKIVRIHSMPSFSKFSSSASPFSFNNEAFLYKEDYS